MSLIKRKKLKKKKAAKASKASSEAASCLNSGLVRLAQAWTRARPSIPLAVIAADRRAAATKNFFN